MRRSLVVALLALAASAIVTGCTVPAPQGPSPLRYRDVVFPAPPTQTADLTYGSAPLPDGTQQALTLDMWRPTGDTQKLRPAIVLVHGGGFVAGDKSEGPMVRMARAFSKRGYVAVSINYRLLGDGDCSREDPPSQQCVDAGFAAQHDAQAAVRWLRKNAQQYGIDPYRIAVAGGSAGAVTALAVGVNSTDPGDSGNPGQGSRVAAAIAISGWIPHDIGPGLYDPSDSPILMFQGTEDPNLPFSDSLQTAVDLYNAHVPVVYEPLEGGGHVPFNEFGDLMISQSVNFAYATLDLAHAAGQPRAAATGFARQAAELKQRYPAAAQALRAQPAIPDR